MLCYVGQDCRVLIWNLVFLACYFTCNFVISKSIAAVAGCLVRVAFALHERGWDSSPGHDRSNPSTFALILPLQNVDSKWICHRSLQIILICSLGKITLTSQWPYVPSKIQILNLQPLTVNEKIKFLERDKNTTYKQAFEMFRHTFILLDF